MAGILGLRAGLKCVVFGAAMVACASVATAQAQESLTASGPFDGPIPLREHAGWNRDCEAIAHPALWLDEAPRHGTVCARSEKIKIHSMYYGTQAQCIGREVSGLRLIYLPRAGHAGQDSVRYAVQYPSVRRIVSVAVTVTAGQANRTGVVVPVLETRQAPGPVPACVDEAS